LYGIEDAAVTVGMARGVLTWMGLKGAGRQCYDRTTVSEMVADDVVIASGTGLLQYETAGDGERGTRTPLWMPRQWV
jgi:hypothetical protein